MSTFISTDSKKLLKKVLCIVMALSLSLMMMPLTVFKSFANAVELPADVPQNSTFGQFVYDVQNPLANNVVFDEVEMLKKIGAQEETELKSLEKVSAAVKAFLVENNYILVDGQIPKPQQNAKYISSSIKNITSDVACVAPSKLADATNNDVTKNPNDPAFAPKWNFAITQPSQDFITGNLKFDINLGTYAADFLVPLENINITSDINRNFDDPTCKGTIKLSKTTSVDENNHPLTMISVNSELKTFSSNSVKYGISVTSKSVNEANNVAENAANNPLKNNLTAGSFDPSTKTVSGVTACDEEIVIPVESLINSDTDTDSPYTIDSIDTESTVFNAKIIDSGNSLELSEFHHSSNDIDLELSLLGASDSNPVSKTLKIKPITKKQIGVSLNDSDCEFDMRESSDQDAYIKNNSWADGVGFTFDNAAYKLKIVDGVQDALWSSYDVELWGVDGGDSQTVDLDKSKFFVEPNESSVYTKDDFEISNDIQIKVKNPDDIDDGFLRFFNGDDYNTAITSESTPSTPSYSDYWFSVNKDNNLIKLSAKDDTLNKDYTLKNKNSQPADTFNDCCYPVDQNVTSGIDTEDKNVSVEALAKNSDDNVIKKIDKTIMFYNGSYVSYTVDYPESGKGNDNNQSDDILNYFKNIVDEIFDSFFFSDSGAKITLTFKNNKAINGVKIGDPDSVDDPEKENCFFECTKKWVGDDHTTWECILDKDKDKAFDYDISEWKVETFQDEDCNISLATCSMESDQGDKLSHIIGNAPAPENVVISVAFEEYNNKKYTDDVITNNKVNFTVNVEMPDNAIELFDYTQKVKANEELVNVSYVNRAPNGNYTIAVNGDVPQNIITYSDFKKVKDENGKPTGTYSLTFSIDVDDNCENKFDVKISTIKDLLNRTAQNGINEDKTFSFSIDKAAPRLSVLWDGPNAINNSFYNSPRTATVEIEDLSFGSADNSLIDVTQNYTDENWQTSSVKFGQKITNWDHSSNSYKHYLKIPFGAQGDYSLVITGKDASGNPIVGTLGTVVNNSTYNSGQFTQDWTAPTLNVSWDNTHAINGKYFTGARNVNFTIYERNFDGQLITYNGANQGWNSAGNNTWTLSIPFGSQGDFSCVLKGTDKALLPFSSYSDEFTIDWSKPNIQISGVENRQAYADTAAPVVTITDKNMSSKTKCDVESLGSTAAHPYSASPSTSREKYTYSYSDPEKIAENDGVYRINVQAYDMAGNSDVKELVWSVNRFGSTYVIDADTEEIMDGYVNKDGIKDVVVTEINPSGVDNHQVEMTKGSFTETLQEGEDYEAQVSGGDGQWYECVFTINKDFFKEDGKYSLNYYSKDKAGHDNENTMENKNTARDSAVNVQFMYDNAKPSVSYTNLSESQYSENSHKATAVFEDNSKKFKEGKVIINGDEQYVSGDDLENDDYSISFDLPDSSTPYTIETVSIDKAGNEMNKDVKNVIVTMNPFLLWFYNTPLFIGSIAGVSLVAGGVAYLLWRKKKLK